MVKLFCDELGYRYLGDWADRADNSNIEEGLLIDYLTIAGFTPPQISTALHKLRTDGRGQVTKALMQHFAVNMDSLARITR